MMKLISTDTEEATLVTLDGLLDKALAVQLEGFFATCNNPVKQTIHIDLKQVEAIKPEGVRVLLNAHINANDNVLKLVNANAGVKQLLDTVGLGKLILH
jgi:anti-anti-sigma factor